MKLGALPIGTKLELEVFEKSGEKLDPVFVSELEWVEDDKIAAIAAPIREGDIYHLHLNCKMNVYFYYNNNLYTFTAVLKGRDHKDNIAYLKINILGEIERIQRREFFRFEWSLPVSVRLVDYINEKFIVKAPFIDTITKNLSGGGICILLEEMLELNEYIECKLFLDPQLIINFYGKIVRMSKLNYGFKYKYEAGILFENIDKKDREAIISCIFKEQGKMRKKGLI